VARAAGMASDWRMRRPSGIVAVQGDVEYERRVGFDDRARHEVDT